MINPRLLKVLVALAIAMFISWTRAQSISLSGDLAFGYVAQGGISSLFLNISNPGTQDLIVSNINYPEGFKGNWSGTIPASNSVYVGVIFQPTAAVVYGGDITVISSAISGSNTLAVSGTASNSVPLPWDFYCSWADRSNSPTWSAASDGFILDIADPNYASYTNYICITNGALCYLGPPSNPFYFYCVRTNSRSIYSVHARVLWDTNNINTAITCYDRKLNITVGTSPLDSGSGTITLIGDNLHINYDACGIQLNYDTNTLYAYAEETNGLSSLTSGFIAPNAGEIWDCGWERTAGNRIKIFFGPNLYELQYQRLQTNFFLNDKYVWFETGGTGTSEGIDAGVQSFGYSGVPGAEDNTYLTNSLLGTQQMVMTWNNQGTLETASNLDGPWVAVTNSGPYTNSPGGTIGFFRINLMQ